jgi:membrane protein
VTGFFVEQFAAGLPDAERAAAVKRIIGFVEGLDFGALGTLGGTLLIFTTLLAVGNVERAFNAIWGVQHQRPWVRRIPDYLAVVLISPLLLGIALSLVASLESQSIVRWLRESAWAAHLLDFGLRHLFPALLIVMGFAFLYWFLPNTQVQWTSAVLGAVVASFLFFVAQRLYVGLSIGAANYNRIFGGFAALPLLMAWLYVSCAITLLGAEVAYAYQTLALYRREVRAEAPSPAARETIGLAVALTVARAFREGAPPYDEETLSEHLDVPLRGVREVVACLDKGGILVRVVDPPREDLWQLARAAETVRVIDVLEALRGSRDANIGAIDVAERVCEVLSEMDAADAEIGSRTLAELVATPQRQDTTRRERAVDEPVDRPRTSH